MVYAPPRPQPWAPAKAAYRPDLRGRMSLGQLERMFGAGALADIVGTGIGVAIAYVGFHYGSTARDYSWVGWVVGAAGSLYALSSFSRLLALR